MSEIKNIVTAFIRVVSLIGILYLLINLAAAFFNKILPQYIYGPVWNSSDISLDKDL